MYDPLLGRFVSADSIVPGSASGAGGGAATLGVDGSAQLTPLTVDFHEPGFVAKANGENAFRTAKGFWFQLSEDDKQQAKRPWGPANPQALNRYSYVLNNPVRYVDPTGHSWYLSQDQANALIAGLDELIKTIETALLGGACTTLAGCLLSIPTVDQLLKEVAKILGKYFAGAFLAELVTVLGIVLAAALPAGLHALDYIKWLRNAIAAANGPEGVALATDVNQKWLIVLNRTNGTATQYSLPWWLGLSDSLVLGGLVVCCDGESDWFKGWHFKEDEVNIVPPR